MSLYRQTQCVFMEGAEQLKRRWDLSPAAHTLWFPKENVLPAFLQPGPSRLHW